jgi:polar amino acid transport system substrate-binding protein
MHFDVLRRLGRTLVAPAAVVLCLLAAGCGSDDSESNATGTTATPGTTTAQGTQAKAPSNLVKGGNLTVCADLTFPPMSYADSSGEPLGFDMDTARAVAQLWNVQLKVKNMPFDGVLPALSSGRCDLAWTGINVTPERLETFDAIPYMSTGLVLITKGGNPDKISRPEDLAGRTAAAQSGTIYAKKLKSLANDLASAGKKPVRIQTYPKTPEVLQQLVVGRADAVLDQDTTAAYREREQPGQFAVAYHYPDKDRFGVYFKKGSETAAALNAALEQLATGGQLAKIAKANELQPESLLIN